MLTAENFERYNRNIMLTGIGEVGQEKLLKSSVLVVGLGGLGCPVTLYLTASGVGHIGLCDFDIVSLSNLQRQALYSENDIGKPKVEAAVKRLSSLNKDVKFTGYMDGLTPTSAPDIIKDYDVIVDCTDNFSTRYLISDTCKELNKPWIFGSVGEYKGMLTTFLPDSGLSFSDLYPDRNELTSRTASNGGVLGVLPATIGSLQATEALKLILGIGYSLSGRLLSFDLLTMTPEIYLFDN